LAFERILKQITHMGIYVILKSQRLFGAFRDYKSGQRL